MIKVSDRVKAIAPSMTLAISAKANELKAAGERVINFGVGEPDFNTPEHVCKQRNISALIFIRFVPAMRAVRAAAAAVTARTPPLMLYFTVNKPRLAQRPRQSCQRANSNEPKPSGVNTGCKSIPIDARMELFISSSGR